MNVTLKRGRPPAIPWGRVVAPFAVGALLYIGATTGAQHTFPNTWFSDLGPGTTPPWYFIGRDLIDGLWAAGGCIAFCAFTLVAARLLGSTVWWAFAANMIAFVGRMGTGVNVLLHTSHALTRSQATTTWPTFETFLQSQKTASGASLVVGMLVAGFSLVWYKRALTIETQRSSNG